MDPSLQPLVARLEHLSDQFRELRDGVRRAVEIADLDPEMALTRARKVLEYVVRDVYERRINEPPGTRPLENLVQRLVKDGFFPDRLDAYANTIRKLGNVGTHTFGENIEVADVYHSLAQLMLILEWYFEAERPDALNGLAQRKPQPQPASAGVVECASPARHMTVVPKGLRPFDANDARFFLDLLPGARDEDGLPESIRFWKHRIESHHETFSVGVMYGPSGCGKSSLVKAGLLPRLDSHVQAIYIEATPDDTESRLLRGLRKRCQGLPAKSGLVKTIAALRRGEENVLIVIDQFEQWLHAHRNEQGPELAKALRQCDGEHVRCILLVREDFWVGLSRFMADLHIELLQGQNMAMVDLFDPMHARNVLAAFGRAYERLQESTTRDQEDFLDQVIKGLAQDGRIICVQLALFAEMVKAKPWLPATLHDLGGVEGVGVNFLEETFSSRTANPAHRRHEDACREVLKALLPGIRSEIKGHMRSHNELLRASGYQSRPEDFAALLGILDTELRLITPTDPQRLEAESTSDPASKYFQLTHDYLVPSLREWLTRKQKATRRGRAALRLADRTTLWTDKPENRYLPTLFEYLNVRMLTSSKNWTTSQRAMMRKAGRIQRVRLGITGAFLCVLITSGLAILRQIEGRRHADHAAALVDQLTKADIAQVPDIVESLRRYRSLVNPLLKEKEEKAENGSPQRLRLALARLPVNAHEVDYLRDQLLAVTPTEFPFVRDALLPHKDAIIEPLWKVALDSNVPIEQRFQAACALASYAPGDGHWKELGTVVASRLVSLQASEFLAWRQALEPAKEQLIEPLSLIYRDQAQKEQSRQYATETLADYAADQPDILFGLLADAEQFQFQLVFEKLVILKERVRTLARQEVGKKLSGDGSEETKEVLAKRQSNAAISLYRIGDYADVWPMLKFSPDPRVRSYVIHRLASLRCNPQAIIERLDSDSEDVTVRRALVLALGEFDATQLPMSQRQTLIDKLLAQYETDPDAGLHGALEWLLRKWRQDDLQAVIEKLKTSEEQLQARKSMDKRRWYVNSQGQTFVILDADEFLMGSPESEPGHVAAGRENSEDQTVDRLQKRFAIAAAEVTHAQYMRFEAVAKDAFVKTDDSAQNGVTWFQAAAYCNWLSEKEGVPKEQWCYEPNAEGMFGPEMTLKGNFHELCGYRLPTEPEWEYACRASTVTSRYHGSSEALLPQYARYLSNGDNHTWPVCSLKPNDFGLFDMLGNVFEWSHERQFEPSSPSTTADELIKTEVRRGLRGGAFTTRSTYMRSANHTSNQPNYRSDSIGIRLARTYP